MMQWIEANGASLRCELTGEPGTTLVLVHEMGGTLESWDAALPRLASGRRVLRYDTRGAGASSRIAGTADIDQMAEDLAALLDALDLSGPVALAGCAVGGAIAVRFAARFPDRAAALVAMAPALGVAAERRQATLERARLAEEQGLAPTADALFDATWPAPLRRDMACYRSYRAKFLANDPASFAAINRMLAGLEMDADLAAIACPTLLLAGAFDQLRPPALIGPLAQRIRDARFIPLPTGHFMAVQTPALVAARIDAFLTEQGL